MTSSSGPRPSPSVVVLWRPRADEHDLAVSLGLCEGSREELAARIEATKQLIANQHPGVPVHVYRWHVWRVVRRLARERMVNSPQNRAAVFGLMAADAEE